MHVLRNYFSYVTFLCKLKKKVGKSAIAKHHYVKALGRGTSVLIFISSSKCNVQMRNII